MVRIVRDYVARVDGENVGVEFFRKTIGEMKGYKASEEKLVFSGPEDTMTLPIQKDDGGDVIMITGEPESIDRVVMDLTDNIERLVLTE